MTRHIMVPLDGSRSAEAALPVASVLAAKLGASVTLLHLLEQTPPQTIHGEPHLHSAQSAAGYLAEVAARSFPPGVTVSTHVDTGGVDNVAAGLAEHGNELHADLLVMCVHGRRRVSQVLSGSLAQKSLALGRVPVLMVRPGQADPFECRSILVPLDSKASHLPALEAAIALGLAFASRLELLTVVPTYGSLRGGSRAVSRMLPGATARVLEVSEMEAQAYVAARAAEASARGVTASSRVVRGDAPRRILKAARALHSDLIVLASHGRAGAGAFWQGSVGSRVSAAGTVPVLLVPAAPEADPAA